MLAISHRKSEEDKKEDDDLTLIEHYESVKARAMRLERNVFRETRSIRPNRNHQDNFRSNDSLCISKNASQNFSMNHGESFLDHSSSQYLANSKMLAANFVIMSPQQQQQSSQQLILSPQQPQPAKRQHPQLKGNRRFMKKVTAGSIPNSKVSSPQRQLQEKRTYSNRGGGAEPSNKYNAIKFRHQQVGVAQPKQILLSSQTLGSLPQQPQQLPQTTTSNISKIGQSV